MATSINLNCLLSRHGPHEIFNVEIAPGDNVSVLKSLIKKTIPITLADTAAEDTQLFKVLLAPEDAGQASDPLQIDDVQELSSPLEKLSTVFPDPLPRELIHIVVVAPPPAPEVIVRKNHLRKAYEVAALSHLAVGTSEALRDVQDIGPIYTGRPVDVTGPPMSIYEPIFAAINDKLDDLESVNGDPLIEAVTKLVVDVNKAYDDDSDSAYQEALESLGAALGITLTEYASAVDVDALSKCKLADNSSEAIVAHVGWNLWTRTGGDRQLQNALCLRNQLVDNRHHKAVINSSCCPAILITMVGPYISFAGFLFAEVWISQAFTPYLLLRLQPGMQKQQIEELCKYFMVFKEAISDLKERYSGVAVRDEMSLPIILPQPKYLQSESPAEDLWFTGRLQFKGLSSDNQRRNIYKAQYGGKPALVKFGGPYGEDAHRLLADEGLAPKLYFCGTIAGGLIMVVMEELSEARQADLAFAYGECLPQQVYDDVKRAVQILHAKNLVFGDLRWPNVLITKLAGPSGQENEDGAWRTQLVDFNWAGIEGCVRYPPLELNPHVPWHPEVGPGSLMKREHDLHMLELLRKSRS